MIDETDPRLVSVKHLDLVDPVLFTSPDLQPQSVFMFGTHIHRNSYVNEESAQCFDPSREYSQNSFGYRGKEEFDSRVELIALGCSQTFGLGVDEDAMWSKAMAKSLNMSQATLAAPGWSVQEMVSSAMAFIDKYGKPKVIAALLPDFGRIMGIEHKKVILSESKDSKPEEYLDIQVKGFHHYGHHSRVKISKSPHLFTDVLPTEWAVYTAAQAWAFFIQYCKVAEISLVWTSWDQTILDMYSMVPEISKHPRYENVVIDTSGFVPHNISIFDEYCIKNLKDIDCHKELKDRWPDSFDFGTDSCKHYGAHAHAHIAEMLSKKYLEF